MTDPHYQRRPAEASHSFELLRGQAVEARLEWRQDPADRARLGWWFVRAGQARAPRRLTIDPAIDDLAADRRRTAEEWSEDADSLAVLTTSAALQRAEQLLRGHIAPPRPRGPALASGTYEIHVTGSDPVTVALAFPTSAIYESAGMVVLQDRFDDESLRTTLDRLEQIGAELVAVLPSDEA